MNEKALYFRDIKIRIAGDNPFDIEKELIKRGVTKLPISIDIGRLFNEYPFKVLAETIWKILKRGLLMEMDINTTSLQYISTLLNDESLEIEFRQLSYLLPLRPFVFDSLLKYWRNNTCLCLLLPTCKEFRLNKFGNELIGSIFTYFIEKNIKWDILYIVNDWDFYTEKRRGIDEIYLVDSTYITSDIEDISISLRRYDFGIYISIATRRDINLMLEEFIKEKGFIYDR